MLRASGVMGEAMVVCLMRACVCVLRASGVMENVVGGSLV